MGKRGCVEVVRPRQSSSRQRRFQARALPHSSAASGSTSPLI